VTRVAVIGGGAWGTALADLLARKGTSTAVTLWAREAEVVESVSREHLNHVFLPGAKLSSSLAADGDLATVVRGADVVVSAAPSHAVRDVMTRARAALDRRALVVSVSKGLEPERLGTLSCVLAEVLPKGTRIAALSGPSFAQEVYARQPTAVVAAAREHAVAQEVQQVFSTGYFRVYSSTDVIGVELGGALKNVIALAAGILEGLGMGHNTRAALVTRGLAEITRLGVALGAEPATFAGLAGMGDLILTCTGPLSRNHSLGVELGRGKRLDEALSGRSSVAEGVTTARSAVALGERHGVELPISREVAAVLFEGKSPRQAVTDLMERELKPEQWGGGGGGGGGGGR
jgi:glycerol-3-phosphate dehydrogenase (NAD(P)+)